MPGAIQTVGRGVSLYQRSLLISVTLSRLHVEVCAKGGRDDDDPSENEGDGWLGDSLTAISS